MKKAEDFISMSKLSYKSRLLQFEIIEEWIKQAQLDAIEETCKFCSENVKIDVVEKPLTSIGYSQTWEVNIQSILDCANILKKELE